MQSAQTQENIFREQGIRRLEAILEDYTGFVVNNLPYLSITGKYGFYLKDLAIQLKSKFLESINTLRSNSTNVDYDSFVRIVDNAKEGLLEFYHLLIDVAQGTTGIPRNLYYFADEMFEKLDGKDVPYIIKTELRENIPGTYEFCRDSKQHLINLQSAGKYLGETKLHAICISPTIVGNPLDWVLMGHEIAHILEKEVIREVQKKYPQVKPFEYLATKSSDGIDSASPTQYEPKWCLELACDLIPALFFGPIYGFRLIENFVTPSELELSATHPFWKTRIGFIADEIRQLGWTSEADEMEAKIKNVRLPNWWKPDYAPKHWAEIRANLIEIVKSKGMEYRHTTERETLVESLRERLSKLKPCISIQGNSVDPRDILNAAERLPQDQRLKLPQFKDFLEDMIRLTITETQYRILKTNQ